MVMNLLKSKNLSHINDLLNHNLHKLYLGLNLLYCDLKEKFITKERKRLEERKGKFIHDKGKLSLKPSYILDTCKHKPCLTLLC